MIHLKIRAIVLPLLILFGSLAVGWRLSHAAATDTTVGDGTPTSCTSAALTTAITAGGTVTFNCGSTPFTLVGGPYVIGNTITLDGGGTVNQGGLITISGGHIIFPFVVNPGANLTLNNITVTDGAHLGDGGAIINYGTLALFNSTIRDSYASGNGGGIYNIGGTVHILSATIQNNHASNHGGGIYNADYTPNERAGVLDFLGATIKGNQADHDGGGVYSAGAATLNDSPTQENSAGGYGGGIAVGGGTFTLRGSAVMNNTADQSYGGGVAVIGGQANVAHMNIWLNRALLGGGGLYINRNDGSDTEVTDSDFYSNTTTAQEPPANNSNAAGGAIFNGGHLTMLRVALRANTAGRGGGLFNDSAASGLELEEATLSGNSADDGGGLWVAGPTEGQAQSLTNVTISGNSGVNSGGGLESVGTLLLQNVTLYANAAPDGANFYQAGVTTLRNTILAAPAGGSNCGFQGNPQPLLSGGHNLVSDSSCNLSATGDLQNQDPLLGPLAFNGSADGGLTYTHLPQNGSPAIDAGDNSSCPATDQRFYVRPVGAACDIGAVEAGAQPANIPTLTPTPSPTATPTTTPTPRPTASPVVPPTDAPTPVLLHSIVPNGVTSSIQLDQQQGRAGQTLIISGQAPTDYHQVRLVAVVDGQTLGGEIVNTDASGNFKASEIIPSQFQPGQVQYCAVPVGATNGQFSCAKLQVAAPLGLQVTGTLPLESGDTLNAQIQLMDAAGSPLFSTAIQPNGTFALANVPPGVYTYAVIGDTSRHVASGIAVLPYNDTSANLNLSFQPACLANGNSSTAVQASPSRPAFQLGQIGSGGGGRLGLIGAVPQNQPFGLYVSGVQNIVTFTAKPQAGGPVQKVIFGFYNPGGALVQQLEGSGPMYQVSFDVGRLAPSQGTHHPFVKAVPVVNGKEDCPSWYDIEVMANPMASPYLQPAPHSSLQWDRGAQVYRFVGVIPYIPNVLPFDYDAPPTNLPPLPYLGRLSNHLDTGVQVDGFFDLNGKAKIHAVGVIAYATVLNKVLLPQGTGVTLLKPNANFYVYDLTSIGFPIGPYPLVPYVWVPTPFVSVPVISFFGVVNVTVNGSAGAGMGVTIEGTIQPLRPAVSATLTARGDAKAELGVGLDLLGGVADVGASTEAYTRLDLPLTVMLSSKPSIAVNACAQLSFSVRAWASFAWGLASKSDTKQIYDWQDCAADVTASAVVTPNLTTPDLIAAPAVASAPDGRILSAYVENSAGAGTTPQVQVFARFQNTDGTSWATPTALSDPSHSAADPAVAFVGPNALPIVVWTENVLTASQAAALGTDYSAIVSHQEIFYSIYLLNVWSPPQRLTTDQVADGMAVLAGSNTSVVLAWVKDTDGNLATRSDQRIAVMIFNAITNSFGPIALLTAGSGGLNAQVSAAYDSRTGTPVPYLAWIHDSDGDLTTANDRTVAVARWDGSAWALIDTQSLPAKADSPTISVNDAGVSVAFLVRDAAEDGSVGLLGANGALWIASLSGTSWSAAPLHDASQAVIYAEQPVLSSHQNESLLLFRRFDDNRSNATLGQISLSRMVGNATLSAPLYLTDESRQNWQPALAINPLTGQAIILKVARSGTSDTASAVSLHAIAATQALMATDATILNDAADPVTALIVAEGADPALDPLHLSIRAPAPNTAVIVSTVVRNVGRGIAQNLTVHLYQGTSSSGTALGAIAVPGTLEFNQSAMITFTVALPAGEQPLYAQVTTTGQDLTPSNDAASTLLGTLAAPLSGVVTANRLYDPALSVTWQRAPDDYVSGYRILRATSNAGAFMLVGESTLDLFTDTLVERGQSYCYTIQAYNDGGAFSPLSPPVCDQVALRNIYLPTVMR